VRLLFSFSGTRRGKKLVRQIAILYLSKEFLKEPTALLCLYGRVQFEMPVCCSLFSEELIRDAGGVFAYDHGS